MAINIILPKLGVEMESARLVEWIVAEGDTVAVDEVIATVETDKVVFELPAPAAGRIHLSGRPDEEYAIGDVLGVVAASDQEYEAVVAGSNGGGVVEVDVDVEVVAPAGAGRDALAAQRRGTTTRVTPVARRVAAVHGVALETVAGRGRGGTIRRRDVEEAMEARPAAQQEAVVVAASAPEKLSGMRQTIARRMHASLRDTAQMTDIREHDVTELVAWRSRVVTRADALGFRVSYTTLLARATILALQRIPLLNSRMESDTELRRFDTINLGMAVAIPDGLLVPVVHGAEQLSLRRLHERLAVVIERARDRSASAEELSGGTFTITNFGSYGTQMGTPILVAPQVGILGIGALLDRPVVRDGEVVPGKVMHTSLTVDHRVIDGETAGTFQNELGRLLTDPDLILFG